MAKIEQLTVDELAQRILQDFSLQQAQDVMASLWQRKAFVYWCRNCQGLHQSPDNAATESELRVIKANYSSVVALVQIEAIAHTGSGGCG